jgi:hypothetical protein
MKQKKKKKKKKKKKIMVRQVKMSYTHIEPTILSSF